MARSSPHPPETDDGLGLAVLDAHRRRFEAGDIVFDEGEPGGTVYLIRSGVVDVTRSGPGGGRCVAHLGPGELFGEQGALVPGPRRSRATVTRGAELLAVEAGVFEEMCLERADIALRVCRSQAARGEALERRLASIEIGDALRAMGRAVLRLARAVPEGARIETTLRTLADDAALGFCDAHRAIQQLVERRIVRLAEDVLTVPDVAALEAVAATSPETPR